MSWSASIRPRPQFRSMLRDAWDESGPSPLPNALSLKFLRFLLTDALSPSYLNLARRWGSSRQTARPRTRPTSTTRRVSDDVADAAADCLVGFTAMSAVRAPTASARVRCLFVTGALLALAPSLRSAVAGLLRELREGHDGASAREKEGRKRPRRAAIGETSRRGWQVHVLPMRDGKHHVQGQRAGHRPAPLPLPSPKMGCALPVRPYAELRAGRRLSREAV